MLMLLLQGLAITSVVPCLVALSNTAFEPVKIFTTARTALHSEFGKLSSPAI